MNRDNLAALIDDSGELKLPPPAVSATNARAHTVVRPEARTVLVRGAGDVFTDGES